MADKTLHSIKFPGLTDIYKIPDIANEYSASSTYAVGDYVNYAGTIYRCTTAITTAEAWTAGHWTAAMISSDFRNEVTDLKSALKSELQTQSEILSKKYEWENIATTQQPYGWRTGYINESGVSTSSTLYIRSNLITSNELSGVRSVYLIPPEGYFIWATIYINDFVSADNFVAQYGDYTKREINKPIQFPLSDGQSVVISLGRFDGDSSDYLTEEFINTILCYPMRNISDDINEIDSSIEELTNAIYQKSFLDWHDISSGPNPTGWRRGYITTEGVSATSNNYLRTNLINSSLLANVKKVTITPPNGYFVWASVFINDYVNADNFVAQYGDYTAQEINKPIKFNITNGQSFVISLGKFSNNSGDYINDNFLNTVQCELLSVLSETPLAGKKFSVVGDSVSAFSTEIPEGYRAYYTGQAVGISSASQMWYNVLANKLSLEKCIINAWSGSCVTYGIRDDTLYLPASSIERTSNLNDGDLTPDIILIAMGVNDYTYMTSETQFGEWDGNTALGSNSDYSDLITTDFVKAYASMIARIQKNYPNATIFCISPWFTQRGNTDTGVTYLNAINKKESDYANEIRKICNIMNVHFIDGSEMGFNRFNFYPTYAQDSETIPTHPNANGHKVMGEYIAQQLLNYYIK